MRVAVIGAGAVGARAARQLHDAAEDLVVVDADGARAEAVVSALGKPARLVGDVDDAVTGASVAVLAVGTGHRALAERALERGADVVSVADTLTEVSELLELDPEARERGRHVVAGAGFSPGLACVSEIRWVMPECTPSRALFFEGRYPLRTNILNVVTGFTLANSQVSPLRPQRRSCSKKLVTTVPPSASFTSLDMPARAGVGDWRFAAAS